MTISATLDQRYGRRTRPQARWAGIGAVAVAVVVVAVFAWTTTSDDVNVDTTGYSVIDQHAVQLSFQVSDAADKEVWCALEAQDTDHGVVGWKVVRIPAADATGQRVMETIPTIALATTGLVNSCWVP